MTKLLYLAEIVPDQPDSDLNQGMMGLYQVQVKPNYTV
jgi:hypothetical protein